MGSGLLEWRKVSILVLLLLPICVGTGICELPEFSHRQDSRWIARSVRREVNLLKWPRISKISPGGVQNSSVLHYIAQLTSRDEVVACAPEFSVSHAEDELSCVANSNLTAETTILSFPIEECITDEVEQGSLHGAPWEVKLASKLLHERSRGDASRWALYISSLPNHIPLPLFFSDMELSNMEDDFVTSEVSKMRQFALLSFHGVRGVDIAYAKFSDYVWALSIAYSLGCSFGNAGRHYLFPFLGFTGTGSEGNVKVTLEGGSLILVSSRDVMKDAAISFYREKTRRSDGFLFQGVVLKHDDVEGAKLFSNLNDVADWFFLQYGGVNNNRVLTAKVIHDAAQLLQQKMGPNVSKEEVLSVNAKGGVAPSLLCILTSLFYAKKGIEDHNKNAGGIAPVEFDIVAGTSWKKVMESIATKSLQPVLHLSTDPNGFSSAFSSSLTAVQERIAALVASQTTDHIEDQILLEGARWEGVPASAEESCSTCRWQIDQQGPNDVLAIDFRSFSKYVLQTALSGSQSPSISTSKFDDISLFKLKSFSRWMEKRGFSISDKLSMTATNVTSYQREAVRGVLATRDIEEGETLCTLPLDAGLYDASVASEALKDSWDLAASRLLQEKALGRRSQWADYIAILPRNMASPLYLDSTELQELQWLPVLREVIQVRRSIKKSFQQFQFPPFTFEEYKWAVIMVHSRAFTLPVLPNDKYSHYVLMPFMDMINHHYTYQADWMSQPVMDRKLEIVAKRTVKKGDQLYASFGPRSNDNLFMYYGFVLEENPFDSLQIFPTFEDAISWFTQTWTTQCRDHFNDTVTYSTCKRSSWKKTWSAVKHGIEDFENGSSGQSKDWWELVSHWADIGYQYLPYQPGPNVYAFGISDPSLMSAFTTASTFVKFSAMEERIQTRNRSASLEKFFACINSLRRKMLDRPLLDRHPCQDHLLRALAAERNGAARKNLIARLSVALRCAEILATLPTSISQDLELLKRKNPSKHIQLAREFRYRKKLQLKSVIDRVVTKQSYLDR